MIVKDGVADVDNDNVAVVVVDDEGAVVGDDDNVAVVVDDDEGADVVDEEGATSVESVSKVYAILSFDLSTFDLSSGNSPVCSKPLIACKRVKQ